MSSLRLAHAVPVTEAEGPFLRHALWLRGCSLRCPGCCNPELFAPEGPATPVAAVVGAIKESRERYSIEGITALGGEPLEQLAGLAELCAQVRALGLGVIVFTGYTLAEARALPGFDALAVDTLVDGRFDARAREPRPGGRRTVGSRNQRIIHFTPRYADPRLWAPGGVEAEVQIAADGEVTVHGAPGPTARLVRVIGDPAARRG